LKDYTRHPYLVRTSPQATAKRRFDRKLLALIPAVLVIVVCWPWIAEFDANFSKILQHIPTVPDGEREVTAVDSPEISFDELLENALRSERQGDRQAAHLAFQSLLKQLAAVGIHNQRSAAVFPRAASFYSKGDELSPARVENLYLGALESIQRVHGDIYYDYESVHRGLEELYLSLHRYEEAVYQTQLLLDFYRRYYPDENIRLAYVAPTIVRLGHNLMQAGRNVEAREAYHVAVELRRSAGQPTSAIESFIETTYPPGEAGTDSIRNLKAAVAAMQVDGITVEQIDEDDHRITIIGYAVDNQRVAAYLRLLNDQLGKPQLNFVQSGLRQETGISEFSIAMQK
jgi:tetratricopeptide (TPR) repeat protein